MRLQNIFNILKNSNGKYQKVFYKERKKSKKN